ncbi:MAG: PIN domain-containing protein [Candidatus Aenigmatarchaeota archaeon]|nr:hypothetical protein [Nanoarchaeota archaeon]
MIFIVDTNIVFSGFVRDSVTRELLIDSPFILYTPDTMIKEIIKYENLILKKSSLSKDEFEILFNFLTENMNVVEKEMYADKMEEADKLIGHVHKGDVPFLALALSIPNSGIWTEDKDFEKQDKIKVWKTKDIIQFLRS